MKGHNYKGVCKKCGDKHIHPKGMLGKVGGGGWKHSEATKRRMRKAAVNKIMPPSSEGKKRKISIANRGYKNGMWKGKNVSYGALHDWIKWHKQKSNVCENCKQIKRLDLANISGKYKRDVNDFEWLCRKCHMIKDGRLIRFYNGRKKK